MYFSPRMYSFKVTGINCSFSHEKSIVNNQHKYFLLMGKWDFSFIIEHNLFLRYVTPIGSPCSVSELFAILCLRHNFQVGENRTNN